MTRPLADDVERLAAYISEENIGLLIVDSAGMAIGAKDGDNWNDGAMRLYAALRQFQTTTLLIDHVAGADLKTSGPTSKMYGGIYKYNLARKIFELQAEQDPVGERTELLLIDTKRNTGAKLPNQGLTITRQDGSIRYARTDIDAPELVRSMPVRSRMQRALRSGSQPYQSLAETLGVPESSVRAAFNRDQKEEVPVFARLPDGRIGLANRD